MMALVGINILIVILASVVLKMAISNFNKSMFTDISFLYFLVIIILPVLLGISNVVLIAIIYPHYLYIAFLPFSIPLIYFYKSKLNQKLGKKKYTELSKIKREIKKIANEFDIEIENDDIRIRILPKNKIDIIINYTKNQRDIINKTIWETSQYLNINKKYKKFHFNFYLNEKKNDYYGFNLIY